MLATEVPDKPLFPAVEAAEILGVSLPTVYRLIESGVLVTHLTRKPYRIRRESLLRLLNP